MARKLRHARKSRLHLESLERRQLLAGNLTAALLSGQLSILGDQAANGLAIVQLPSSSLPGAPPSATLWLKPDATTRLNGQAPGVGLVVQGVTGGVSASLGEGADLLNVTGRAGTSLASMSLDLGGGNDDVTIKGVKILQNVALHSSGGSDVVRIADSAMDGDADVEMTGDLDLSVERSSLASIYMKIDGVSGSVASYLKIKLTDVLVSSVVGAETSSNLDVSVDGGDIGQMLLHKDWRSSSPAGVVQQSYLKITDAVVRGAVDVDVEGGSLDFTSQGTQAGPIYIKIDDVDGEAVSSSRVTLADSEVDGPLWLSTDGSVDFSSKRTDHKEWILLESTQFSEPPLEEISFVFHKIEFEDSVVSGFVSVDTHGSGLDFSSHGSQLAAIYMKYDGVDGSAAFPPGTARVSLSDSSVDGPLSLSTDLNVDFSSTRDKHKDWIEIQSVQLGASRSGPPALHKVKFVDTLVSSYVDVDVEGAGVLEVAAQSLEAGGMYIKFDGVDGEAARSTSVSLDSSSIGEELLVETQGQLSLHCANGEHIKKATLTVRKQGTEQQDYYVVTLSDLLVSSLSVGDSDEEGVHLSMQGATAESLSLEGRSSTGSPVEYYKVTLEDCLISSYAAVDVDGDVDVFVDGSSLAAFTVHGGDNHDRPMESLSLNFTKVEMKYHQQGERSLSLSGGSMDSVSVQMSGDPLFDPTDFFKIEFTDVQVSGLASVNMVDFLDDDFYSVDVSGSEIGALEISSSRGSGGGAGKVSFSDLSLMSVHVLDNGASVAIDLDGGQCGSLSIQQDGSPLAGKEDHFFTIEIKECRVSSFAKIDVPGDVDVSVDGSSLAAFSVSSGGDRPMESLSLNFTKIKMEYHQQGERSLSLTGGSMDSLSVQCDTLPPDGTQPLYVVKLTDCLVSSYALVDVDGDIDLSVDGSSLASFSVHGGDSHSRPMESLSLNFTKVEMKYHQQGERSLSLTGGSMESLLVVDTRDPVPGSVDYFKVTLEDCLVTSYSSVHAEGGLDFSATNGQMGRLSLSAGGGGGGGSGGMSMESQSFNFAKVEFKYSPQGGDRSITIGGGKTESVSIEADGSDSPAPQTFFKVTMSDLLVSSFVDVEVDDASVSLEISRSAAGGVRVAVGDLNGDGRADLAQVKLTDVLVSGLADFDNDGFVDIVVARSRLGSLSVDAEGGSTVAGTPGGSSRLTLDTARVLGRTTVDLGSGDDIVLLSRAILSGSSSLSMGSGNDRLTAVDSIFARFALLDGGDGFDTLTVARTRFAQSPFVRNWEPPAPA